MLKKIVFVSFVSFVAALAPANALAETRWALIISGASGGEKYAEQMATWRGDLQKVLVERYQFKPEFVKTLVDEARSPASRASAPTCAPCSARSRRAPPRTTSS